MFGWVVQYLVYDAKFFCINWRHELVSLHARLCKQNIKTNQSHYSTTKKEKQYFVASTNIKVYHEQG
jgi:hypothetical protein